MKSQLFSCLFIVAAKVKCISDWLAPLPVVYTPPTQKASFKFVDREEFKDQEEMDDSRVVELTITNSGWKKDGGDEQNHKTIMLSSDIRYVSLSFYSKWKEEGTVFESEGGFLEAPGYKDKPRMSIKKLAIDDLWGLRRTLYIKRVEEDAPVSFTMKREGWKSDFLRNRKFVVRFY